jgi:hypothetical protein
MNITFECSIYRFTMSVGLATPGASGLANSKSPGLKFSSERERLWEFLVWIAAEGSFSPRTGFERAMMEEPS